MIIKMDDFELDHIFIRCQNEASEAQDLRAIGLIEGASRAHPGQGTANRRFFFDNMMLELLYLDGTVITDASNSNRLKLDTRLNPQAKDACPFGLAFRPKLAETTQKPFAGWSYQPSYLPEPLEIWIAENSNKPSEPLLFYLSFARPKSTNENIQTTAFNYISGVSMTLPLAVKSELFDNLAQIDALRFNYGTHYALDIEFNHRQCEHQQHFPELALTLYW